MVEAEFEAEVRTDTASDRRALLIEQPNQNLRNYPLTFRLGYRPAPVGASTSVSNDSPSSKRLAAERP